jgi:hypothetical protein
LVVIFIIGGSGRFLKDTINSWPYNPQNGLPKYAAVDSRGMIVLAPGTQGIYQALSTRNGGEVISFDSF